MSRPDAAVRGTAHLDLAATIGLDTDAVQVLAEVHRRLTEAGWAFRVTPPDDVEARSVFIAAATQGVFGWAAPVSRPLQEVENDESA